MEGARPCTLRSPRAPSSSLRSYRAEPRCASTSLCSFMRDPVLPPGLCQAGNSYPSSQTHGRHPVLRGASPGCPSPPPRPCSLSSAFRRAHCALLSRCSSRTVSRPSCSPGQPVLHLPVLRDPLMPTLLDRRRHAVKISDVMVEWMPSLPRNISIKHCMCVSISFKNEKMAELTYFYDFHSAYIIKAFLHELHCIDANRPLKSFYLLTKTTTFLLQFLRRQAS